MLFIFLILWLLLAAKKKVFAELRLALPLKQRVTTAGVLAL
jgi:hypothetical protein